MFDAIKKKILEDKYKKQILELESRMSRSQAALIKAALQNEDPDPEDVKYHEKYMKEIAELRAKIREIEKDSEK